MSIFQKIAIPVLVTVVLLFNSCQKDPPDDPFIPEPVMCFENIIGACNYLSEDEIMLFLSRNSCSGYCVMQKFMKDCPDQTYINNYVLSPAEYLNFFYSDADLNFDSVTATNVLIHESMHHVSYAETDSPDDLFIMLNCDQDWVVEMIPTFSCEELATVIDEDHRTQRYDTYIEAIPSHVTQTRGIYGLLNEFNSYYQSGLAVLEVGKSTGALADPIASTVHSINTVIPYYEVNYWILTYLIYAEQNHPSDFNNTMGNEEFKESYLMLEEEFKKVIDEMSTFSNPLSGSNMTEVNNVIDALNSSEYLEMMERLAE